MAKIWCMVGKRERERERNGYDVMEKGLGEMRRRKRTKRNDSKG